MDFLHNKKIHGLKLESKGNYEFYLDEVLIEHKNKDSSRKGYFEKIELRDKTKKEVKEIISSLPYQFMAIERRTGAHTLNNEFILCEGRKNLLLSRIEEAQDIQIKSKL